MNMVLQKTRLEEPQKEEFSWKSRAAHSTHDFLPTRRKRVLRRDNAASKEALVEPPSEEPRVQYHRGLPVHILQLYIRVYALEREIARLKRQFPARSDVPPLITAEEYPSLAAVWDNDGDDIYEAL